MPPSTRNSVPVIEDSSEAKEQSGGSHFFGFSKAPHGDVHQAALFLLFRIQEFHQEVGAQKFWAKRIHPNTFAGMDDGEFAGHRQHGALAGIGDLRSGGAQVRHKGYRIDDGAAAGTLRSRMPFTSEEHPLTLMLIVRSQMDSSVETASPSSLCMMPALLKRMFSLPKAFSAKKPPSFSQSAALETSARSSLPCRPAPGCGLRPVYRLRRDIGDDNFCSFLREEQRRFNRCRCCPR